jgi:GTPase involved in cell partitioning and DNA repair
MCLQLLGEVVQPGDRILVAKGGKGGMGVVAPSRGQKQRDLQREIKAAKVGMIGNQQWTAELVSCIVLGLV